MKLNQLVHYTLGEGNIFVFRWRFLYNTGDR